MTSPRLRLSVTRLPFVGERADGRFGYWVLPVLADDADPRIQGRTFAAWFLLYEEANGKPAARELMDKIEREMPSRYPAVDRAFLWEISRSHASKTSSAA
ncbi:hypothetical protein [Niveispirillum sp. BGYR6]|uniref:hypothetical protein n=1 Tax=Niveispirillum sp. BGYR6 TaxID=2971249 RepID=UPI0022B97ED0|nr:hypothetical protein [Niveispirillum sp. BGYR6]MDG5495420.1 hypothetical protein [Niveispirillum sp. BGYR6]